MTVDPRSPESSIHEASASGQQVRRFTGRLSGLAYQVEECPDGRGRDGKVAVAAGGGVGYLAGLLLGASFGGRLLGAALGAGAGAALARWHVRLDWDPDGLRATLRQLGGAGGSDRQAV